MEQDTLKKFADFHEITYEVAQYLTRKSECLCVCGNFKKLQKSPQSKVGLAMAGVCSDKRCNPRYGKKRPEHSAIMRELVRSGSSEKYSNNLIKQGQILNIEVNSAAFKRKVLENKDIVVEDIENDFSKYLSGMVKSTEVRIKQCISRYENWENEYKELVILICGQPPTIELLSALSPAEVDTIWTKIHGVNTIRNNNNSMAVGKNNWFNTDTLVDLKFNTSGLSSVRVRSGWEASMIYLLEKHQIPWAYEEYKIVSLDGSGFYVPDFVYTIDGITYMVEIKGSYYRQDKETYIRNKVGAGVQYCKNKGWRFVLTHKQPKSLIFKEEEFLC